MQSTKKHPNSGPDLAVDGLIFNSTLSTTTQSTTNQWWKVDLYDVYRIYTVVLYTIIDGRYGFMFGAFSICAVTVNSLMSSMPVTNRHRNNVE